MSDSNGISFKDPLSPILALVFTIVGAFLTYRVGLVKDIPFNKIKRSCDRGTKKNTT